MIDFRDGQWFADDKAALLTDVARSYSRCSPERLARRNSSAPPWNAYAQDWWNLGVATYEFLSGQHPLFTKDAVQVRLQSVLPPDCKLTKDRYVRNQLTLEGLARYVAGDSLQFDEGTSAETRGFIFKLLSLKAEERCPSKSAAW